MSIEKVQKAVRHLSRHCDRALALDGCGFNKIDASFGRSLAGQEHWTPNQVRAAQRMLRKYRGQLESAGFDMNEVLEEIQTASPAERGENNMIGTATVKDNLIEIKFPFNWEVLEAVKTIPGRRFQSTGKYWTAPVGFEAAKILKETGFQLDETLKGLLEEQVPVEKVQMVEVQGLKRELFPFQRQGVSFIESRNGRALIGDEMGLGKTIQAIAWLALHPELRPAIIVCPATLKLNWESEIRKTIPGTPNIQVLNGTDTNQPLYGDYIIINFDILPNKYDVNGRSKKEIPGTGWVDFLIKKNPKVLIVDEAHYIKSNKANRTKGVKKLAKKVPHVIGLTGTPIVNRPIESFNIMQIINKTVFPDFWKFAQTYCGAKHTGFGWDFSGATNKEQLHKILTDTIMLRRKKEDVLTDLPAKLYSYIPMELGNNSEYKRAETDFIKYIRETKGKEAAMKARQAEHLAQIEALKQLCIKGKMSQACQWIEEFLETSDSKLIVFAVHKTTIDALMTRFRNISVKIDGSVTPSEREHAVQAFQNDPEIKLFIGNIQAAGVGITLTASSAVAFLELPWTPGDLMQAEDRAHRIGQKKNVNIYYLLASNTIEEKIAALLDEKKKVLGAVLDGKEEFENAELIKELMEAYE